MGRRYVVYGLGAIGGTVAARMHMAGLHVAGIARGAHLEAVRSGGLRLDDPDGSTTVRLEVAGDPAELGIVDGDVVLLAMKSQDIEPALAALCVASGPSTPIVCLQNGVANERAALRRFENVYAVPVMCPSDHLEPGVIGHYSAPSAGILDVGRYPSGVDELCGELAAAFESAGFASVARPDIMRWKYSKLRMNLGNAVEALFAPGEAVELFSAARMEAAACYAAAGIDCASEEEERERRGDLISLRRVNGERRGGGSSWQSLARGLGSIEVDYLNGEIVLLGRLHDVPTPANATLQRLANEHARLRTPPGTVTVP